MLHYAARQREEDQRWDYTCKDKLGHIYSVGYCIPYSRIDPDKGKNVIVCSEEYKERIRSSKDKYHITGHATKEEAENCYKDYILTEMSEYDCIDSDMMHRCVVCEKFTQRYVKIGGWSRFTLCDKHARREVVEMLYEVHESFEGAE